MTFNSTNDVIEYFQKLLTQKIEVDFYSLKHILEMNNIEINDIILTDVEELKPLSLVSINLHNENSINIYLNSKSWIDYLPEMYQNNDFLKRFLFGFQSTFLTQEEIINNINLLFKPENSQFVDWLSSWFGVHLSNVISDKSKRIMLYNIMELYRMRGTKKYFIRLIKILTDVDIKIVEDKDIISKSLSNKNKNHFTVVIDTRISEEIKEEHLKLKIITNIMEKEKPINTKMDIDYHFIKNEVKTNEDEKLIDFHSEYNNDDYDYDNL